MQGAVWLQADGIPFIDAQAGQLPVRVGQDAGSARSILQGNIAQHRLPGGQFLAAIQLLIDAQHTVFRHGTALLCFFLII